MYVEFFFPLFYEDSKDIIGLKNRVGMFGPETNITPDILMFLVSTIFFGSLIADTGKISVFIIVNLPSHVAIIFSKLLRLKGTYMYTQKYKREKDRE